MKFIGGKQELVFRELDTIDTDDVRNSHVDGGAQPRTRAATDVQNASRQSKREKFGQGSSGTIEGVQICRVIVINAHCEERFWLRQILFGWCNRSHLRNPVKNPFRRPLIRNRSAC